MIQTALSPRVLRSALRDNFPHSDFLLEAYDDGTLIVGVKGPADLDAVRVQILKRLPRDSEFVVVCLVSHD